MSINALKVSNLVKDFGGLTAVNDVTFEVSVGSMVGLIGPNGCGKSTTFNCISGMLEVTSGQIEVLGRLTTGKRPDEIQKLGLTRTFQHTRLWRDMTVIENLLVPSRHQFQPNIFLSLLKPNSRPAEHRRVVNAYKILDALEVGHIAHNLASELSGGQSKLVDIGRALMSDPEFLLLDEPVAGVAGPLAEKIFNNLKSLCKDDGIGMLIIEHNMEFILRRGVDHVIVMDNGKVLAEGTPDDIRERDDVVEAYLGTGARS